LINSLNNFLLAIIQSESLPVREVYELANPRSPLNQHPIAHGNGSGNGGGTGERKLPGLTPDDVAWATAPAIQGIPVIATAVYCLYGIYYAQPGPLITKIRISKEQQETIKHITTCLAESNALDAVSLLAQLVKDTALLPGSSQQPDTSLTNVNININTITGVDGDAGAGASGGGASSTLPPASTLAPGTGASYIIPGLKGEDAATLREVHFHLDSTLTGLGTGHLDPLCRGYGQKLKELWSTLGHYEVTKNKNNTSNVSNVAVKGIKGDGNSGRAKSNVRGGGGKGAVKSTEEKQQQQQQESQQQQEQLLEGIADLSLGKFLHEYATTKREELQLNLQYGPNWRDKLLKKDLELGSKRGATTSVAAGPSAGGGVSTSTAAAKEKGASGGSRKKKTLSAAAIGNISGVPGNISRQLLAREKARQVDMARRSKPWADIMGVDNIIEKELHGATANNTSTGAMNPFVPGGLGLGLGLGVDSDEDMPFVPGLQSEFEYLAGPSGLDTTGGTAAAGGGSGSTKMTDTTIQGTRGKKRRNNKDSSDDDSLSSSSSSSSDSESSSSSDDSSSSDSYSDGEEVHMIQQSRGKHKRAGAVGGGASRGGKKAAGAATAPKGNGKGTPAVPAVSTGSGMRGGKKAAPKAGVGKAAPKPRKKSAAAAAAENAATQDIVQRLLSEIDMVLEEDDMM
jgi:Small nuclear RNA activating complex (SNAPc), subunit 1